MKLLILRLCLWILDLMFNYSDLDEDTERALAGITLDLERVVEDLQSQ